MMVTRSIDNALLVKLNAYNCMITRVASSPLNAGSFLVDHQGNVRYSFGVMNDGSNAAYRMDGASWSVVEKSAPFVGRSFFPVGFSADDRQSFVLNSSGVAAQSLWRVDPLTSDGKEVSRPGTVPSRRLLWRSETTTLLAVRY